MCRQKYTIQMCSVCWRAVQTPTSDTSAGSTLPNERDIEYCNKAPRDPASPCPKYTSTKFRESKKIFISGPCHLCTQAGREPYPPTTESDNVNHENGGGFSTSLRSRTSTTSTSKSTDSSDANSDSTDEDEYEYLTPFGNTAHSCFPISPDAGVEAVRHKAEPKLGVYRCLCGRRFYRTERTLECGECGILIVYRDGDGSLVK